MEKFKKTLLIDLDGVLNLYAGNYDKDIIPPLKEGAYEFLQDLADDFKIVIFTSRNIFLTSKWVIENGIDDFIADITNVKIPSYLIIDDRCINFEGNYTKTKKQINDFEVWYNQT